MDWLGWAGCFHDHLMTARIERRGGGGGLRKGREGITLFIFSCFKSDVGFGDYFYTC